MPSTCTAATAVRVAALLAETTSSSADICVLGWAEHSNAYANRSAPRIDPAWLWYGIGTFFVWDHSPGDATALECDLTRCGEVFDPFVAPNTTLDLSKRTGWVLLIGHLNDPASATCRFVYPAGWTAATVPDAEAIARCSSDFVVTAIAVGSAPTP